jgi:hypothetical protein
MNNAAGWGKAQSLRYLEACGYTLEAASAAAAKYSGHSGRVACTRRRPRPALSSRLWRIWPCRKSLNVAQKYAKQADQLWRAPTRNPAAGDLNWSCRQ